MTRPIKFIWLNGKLVGLGEWTAGDTLPITQGGTGATDAAGARSALVLANHNLVGVDASGIPTLRGGMVVGSLGGTQYIDWGTAGGIRLSRPNLGPRDTLTTRTEAGAYTIDIAASTDWTGGVNILPNGGGRLRVGPIVDDGVSEAQFGGRISAIGAYQSTAPAASDVGIARFNNGGAVSLKVGGYAYNGMSVQSIQDDGTNNSKTLYLNPLGGLVTIGAGGLEVGGAISMTDKATTRGNLGLTNHERLIVDPNANVAVRQVISKVTSADYGLIAYQYNGAELAGYVALGHYGDSGGDGSIESGGSLNFRAGGANKYGTLLSSGRWLMGPTLPADDGVSAAQFGGNARVAGNLGIGIAPISTGYGAGLMLSADNYTDLGAIWIQPINTNDHRLAITNNAKNTGVGSWSYFASSQNATKYEQLAGRHVFSTAVPANSGAAVTWSDSVVIDAYGNMLLGAPSNVAGHRLVVSNNANNHYGIDVSISGVIRHRSLGWGVGQSFSVYDNGGTERSLLYSTKGELVVVKEMATLPVLGTAFDYGIALVAREDLWGCWVGNQNTTGNTWIQAGRRDTATAYNLLIQPVGGRVIVGNTPDDGASVLQAGGAGRFTGGLLVNTTTFSGLWNGAGIGYAVDSSGTITSTRNSDSNAYWSKATGYTNTNFHAFFVAGAAVGSISTNGSSTSYNTTSDRRLKSNIKPAADSGAILDSLEIVSHDWLAGGHADYGVIAQDVYDIFPAAVSPGDAGAKIKTAWGVDYSKFVAPLIKEVQSLRRRLAAIGA